MCRLRVKRSAIVLALLVLSLPAARWAVLPGPALSAEAVKEASKDPLHPIMEDLSGTFRKVRRQVKDPQQNEATAAMILQMEGDVMKAKAMTPLRIAALPKDKQPDAIRHYRLRMIDLMTEMLKAEKAVLEARNDDAYDSVKRMAVIQEECHKALGVEEE